MLKDILIGRIRRAFNQPVRPQLMTFNVTGKCNCRCAMCDIYARTNAEEITTPEIRKIFGDPLLRSLRILRITGGEPFIRDDIAEIYDAAAQTPVRVFHITTNAGFPEKIEGFLKSVNLSRTHLKLQISLDAAGELHDKIRGVPGLFDRVVATLERIKKFTGNRNFSAGINQTVILQNMDEMERVHELAREYKIAHNIILGAKYCEGTAATHYPSAGSPLPFELYQPMSGEQTEELYRRIAAMKRTHAQTTLRFASWSAWLRGISDEYLHEGGRNRLIKKRNFPKPICSALFNHFRLLPDGTVTACTALRTQTAGNVRTHTLSKIWYSAEAGDIRRSVRKCPGCWVECDIIPSAFFTGDIILWALKKVITGDSSFISSYLRPHWLIQTIRDGPKK
ncbi:MAG: radical SAM protein [bacterium]